MPQSRPRPSLAPSRPGRVAGLSPLAPRYRARREARPLGDQKPSPKRGESFTPTRARLSARHLLILTTSERHLFGQGSTRAAFRKDLRMTIDNTNEQSGADLRDAAIEQVLAGDEAPHRGHRAEVERILADLIESGQEFSADTINRALPADVRDHASPYLTPAVLRVASQAGRIRVVGYAISERPSRHKGILRVWRGVHVIEEAA